MCTEINKHENQILLVSAFLASAFAFGGLILGYLVGSLVIVFDGFYSLVSLLLTLLSLAVSNYIQKPSKSIFPFGKAILEPIVIAFKGAVILIVVGLSLYFAIVALFTGGREIDTSIASLFGFVNVVGCGYAWWYISQKNRHNTSGLIDAESKQWKMDTLLSIAVTLGFISAWLISLSPLSHLAVYADPFMMCAISVYFIKVPFDMFKEAVRELLMMRPNEEICTHVDEGILAAEKESKQKISLAGLTKVGRELRVNVDIDTRSLEFIAIDDIEKTRKTLSNRLSKLPFDLQLTLRVAR